MRRLWGRLVSVRLTSDISVSHSLRSRFIISSLVLRLSKKFLKMLLPLVFAQLRKLMKHVSAIVSSYWSMFASQLITLIVLNWNDQLKISPEWNVKTKIPIALIQREGNEKSPNCCTVRTYENILWFLNWKCSRRLHGHWFSSTLALSVRS